MRTFILNNRVVHSRSQPAALFIVSAPNTAVLRR
jgi:hypothetical protein